MRLPSALTVLGLSMGLASAAAVDATLACNRKCMSSMIDQLLASMVAHDPYTLPLASTYKATENGHPAALEMMTAWRTIVTAGTPSLVAIDVKNGTAYFALDVSEGNAATPAVFRGRIAVVNRKFTEVELFFNRFRGDHGFSFNSTTLPGNYATLMSPPSSRVKATRKELMYVSAGLFGNYTTVINSSSTCQFTEIGWQVIDNGTDGTVADGGPIKCGWPAAHPYDVNARLGLVVDEDLGFIVQSGMIPGRVYPYANVSAFIPNVFTAAQQAQVDWAKNITYPKLQDFGATGETLEVLQFYDGVLQAMQINVYLQNPGATSAWLS